MSHLIIPAGFSPASTQSTQFGEVPEHWIIMELGQCAIIQTGVAKGRNLHGERTVELPYLRVANVQDGYLDLSEIKRIELRESEVEQHTLQPGDVVVTEGGDFDKLGRGFLWEGQIPACVHQNHIFAVRANHSLLMPEYLAYLIQSRYGKAYFLSVAHKTTNLASINSAKLKAFPVPLPPLSEQRVIAQTMRTVQDAIQVRQHEVELERERKAALIQHLFTYGTRGEPTKQTEVGEMPESWRVVHLGDICANNQGTIQTGPFGSQLHASDYKLAGIPVVNPTHMGFNTIIEDHLPFISKEDAERLSRHYLLEGDILISRRGDFSRFSYITHKQAGWLCGTGCLLIRLQNPALDNFYFSVAMSTEPIQSYLAQNSVGSIMPNLNTQILEAMPLPLPPVSEQHVIAGSLRACSEKICTLEQETTLLDELFRALLEELMTGRLPTSVLAAVPSL